MAECKPPAGRCDLTPTIAAELAAAGLDGAAEVGAGGFGAVYRCHQRSLERVVAVKILSTESIPTTSSGCYCSCRSSSSLLKNRAVSSADGDPARESASARRSRSMIVVSFLKTAPANGVCPRLLCRSTSAPRAISAATAASCPW